MKEKTILTKLTELAMSCQKNKVANTLKQIRSMPATPELEEFKEKMLTEHEYFMIDCKAILKAEKQYLKSIQSQNDPGAN
ncbi:hypothetical protein N9164_09875 [Draconibacterium sp.]|nr:hypothetical protein [Draconibacterium sp.]